MKYRDRKFLDNLHLPIYNIFKSGTDLNKSQFMTFEISKTLLLLLMIYCFNEQKEELIINSKSNGHYNSLNMNLTR